MKKDTTKKWLREHRAKEHQLVRSCPIKALRVIDMLTCNDDFSDNKLLSTIYRVAHSASGICDNPHKDWREETNKLYKELGDENF